MRPWLVLMGAAALLLMVDQVSKYMAVRDLTVLFERADVSELVERVRLFYGEAGIEHLREPTVEVLPFWRHSYTENPGAALGLLAGRDAAFRLVFFGVVSLLAVAFVFVMAYKIDPKRFFAHMALGAVLGGVLGNFVCRLTRGYVIDFVDWRVQGWARLDFPTFNVADVGITGGVVVLLVMTAREVFRNDS